MSEEQNVEWRALLLREIRDSREEIKELRADFQRFQLDVVSKQSEEKGRHTIISAGVSFLISGAFLLAKILFAKKP